MLTTYPQRLRAGLKQHCTRCHRSFAKGSTEACTVPHVFLDNYERDQGKDGKVYNSSCCDDTVQLVVENGGGKINIVPEGEHSQPLERHTTGRVKYNHLNTHPCKLDGSGLCTRQPLVELRESKHDGLPLFDAEVQRVRGEEDEDE